MEVLTPDLLAFKLSSPQVQNDYILCRTFMARVMALTTQRAVDLSPLLAPVVNLLAHSDLLVKKMACNFLCKNSGSQSELMLLAVNTLLKDCKESNPMVRGLALRTICAGSHPAFQEHQLPCLVSGLDDHSAFVRRTAVMACLKINQDQREALLESGVVDKLYSMIRDQDPVVTVNCLLVLDEVLKAEGGIVVNKNMVKYLVSRLEEYTAWGVQYVLKIVRKYMPKTEEEVFDLMNILDPYLQHNSLTICMQALELFTSLIKDMPHLQEEVIQRSMNSFLGAFSSGNVEMMTVIMDYLEKYADLSAARFVNHHQSFFCRNKDPDYLKEKKMKFLTKLLTEDNLPEILEEVLSNSYDKSQSVSLCSIQALAEMAQKFPRISESLIKAFKRLLSSDSDHILSNTLQVLADMTFTSLDNTEELALKLCEISRKVKDTNGRVAILILIGQFGCGMSESTYLLEQLIEEFADLDPEVKSQLLLTCLKVFCHRPAECQPVLGELLELCLEDKDRCLSDQAKFYFSLLQGDARVLCKLMSDQLSQGNR